MTSFGKFNSPFLPRCFRIDRLPRLAAEYQLVLKYRKEFHDMFTEFSDHSEFGPLMTRMQVVDGRGDSKMDEEQWEAASESNMVPSSIS